MARGYLTWCLADRGEFEEGIAHGQEGIRPRRSARSPPTAWPSCRWILANLRRPPGESSATPSASLERALALSREWNLTFLS